MKKLFQNYNFEFNSSEKKILGTFLKQVLKQLGDNKDYYPYTTAYKSVLEKINSGDETIRLTKDEKGKVKEQLENSLKLYKKEIKKAWFFKRWLYRSMITQYEALVENHFKN
ncbi:MAG: hypothetical protein Q8903_04795 [Bacteroidota bacterium]|nr:hypothetical protein [Bacteroidota bacterium]